MTYPDDHHAKTVCKIGQRAETCRYLTLHGAAGWSCEKATDVGRLLDERVAQNTINARGDNCSGLASRSAAATPSSPNPRSVSTSPRGVS